MNEFLVLRISLIAPLVFLLANFASFLPAATFTNVTSSVIPGMDGRKVAWGDFDNDGFVDLHAGGYAWRNNGGVNFTRMATVMSRDGIWGNYNNDGFLDFFVYATAPRLYRGNGGTGFTEANLPSLPTIDPMGASWGDYNNDSFLDLYVGGYQGSQGEYRPDVRLRNNQGLSFTRTWTQSNDAVVTPNRPRPGRGITSADFDSDGDLDVYVSNYRLEPNQLWVNDGQGDFDEQATARGVAGTRSSGVWGHSIGATWGDFDNDGEIDLFNGNFSHPPSYQDRSHFFRNTGTAGGYSFQDMGQGGVVWQESYGSPVLGDYDNDGDLDLYFTTVYSGDEPRLYRNNGNWQFTDVTYTMGLAGLGPTYQAGFADYDNDGDLDLVTDSKLFRNQGNSNHWLKVKLIGDGQAISRDAVGAQVRIQLGSQTLLRQVEFGTGEGNQNDATLHFGLGQHSGLVDLEILWPGGKAQFADNVAIDQLATIDYAPGNILARWSGASAGLWTSATSWIPRAVPTGDAATVFLTGGSSSITDIELPSLVTVQDIKVDGSSSFHLSGNGTLRLNAESGEAHVSVKGGDHSWYTTVEADADTNIDVAGGASLTLDGKFDFAGATVVKDGAGRLNFNGVAIASVGSLHVLDGVIGGDGAVNGNLTVTRGVVAPGHDLGKLQVRGDFELQSQATLQIQIEGPSTSQFDSLSVAGVAELGGSLEIVLTDEYEHQHGRGYLVLTSGNLVDNGLTITGPAATLFDLELGSGQILLRARPEPAVYQWASATGGSWQTVAHWSPAIVPPDRGAVRITGGTSPTTTIQLDVPITIGQIEIDGTSAYHFTGNSLQLDSDDGAAGVMVTAGNHVWDVNVTTSTDTSIDVTAGASLSITGRFDFENVTVTKQGAGELYLDGSSIADGGSFDVLGGVVGGKGIVNGDLNVTRGTLRLGHDIGRLQLGGDFSLAPEGMLEFEIAGSSTAAYDSLVIEGSARLAGTLDVTLADDYEPEIGRMFLVLTAADVLHNGIALTGPNADRFRLVVGGSTVILETISPSLDGDYNSDGIVDAADFTRWRDTLGEQVARSSGADGSGNGTIDRADYAVWKTNFGSVAASASSALVPEPSTAYLLLFALVSAYPRRRGWLPWV